MRIIRCKKCFKPCTVKVSSRGTVSSCCDSSVYLVEEPIDRPISFIEKAFRVGKGAAIVILILAFCLITWMLYQVFTAPVDPPPSKFRMISIERALGNMDIRPESVEIHPNGRLYYVMAGKRYEIEE